MEEKISVIKANRNEGGLRRKVTIPRKTRHSVTDSDWADISPFNPYSN